tara:strand:- start:1559 stop:2314 length:756 start_codon:yes stop_codon:yes gene_type:complete
MNKKASKSRFNGLKIAITGAKGGLGLALIEELKDKGAYVAGLTHSKDTKSFSIKSCPNEWITWSSGQEKLLSTKLNEFDILILNHGFNPKGNFDSDEITKAIEINSLSQWRLIQIFEDIALENSKNKETNYGAKELWINTSEAEIQIAFSPVYELTKRMIGEIVSIKKSKLLIEKNTQLNLKKLVLGPFKSNLNPQGIMTPRFVAKQVIRIAENDKYLIIVSPNPFTYLLMPITELLRISYSIFIKLIYSR